MFILAIIKDDDPLLAAERELLVAWAPANGWDYIEYADSVDLLARISDLEIRQIRELEIVAHGNAAECDDIGIGNARPFGESLQRIAGFSRSSAVYLSGCNTGLSFGGDCIAQILAEACGASVCGARGYLTGTHAEKNERACLRLRIRVSSTSRWRMQEKQRVMTSGAALVHLSERLTETTWRSKSQHPVLDR